MLKECPPLSCFTSMDGRTVLLSKTSLSLFLVQSISVDATGSEKCLAVGKIVLGQEPDDLNSRFVFLLIVVKKPHNIKFIFLFFRCTIQ